MKKIMSMGDKIIAILMGICIICAISTIVSYLLYELFNIGEAYFSTAFFMCSMVGAVSLIRLGVIILNVGVKQ